MIKYKNVTDLKDVRKKVNDGTIIIEKVSSGKVRVTNNIYNDTPYIYMLEEKENGLYCFSSKNDIPFSVLFRSNSNDVEILEGEKEGHKYKSDKFLKQFMRTCCLPNSLILSYDLF